LDKEPLYSPATTFPDPAVMIEPARAQRPVFWESTDGTIRRGTYICFAMTRERGNALFWIGIEDERGKFTWVRDDRLRSRAQYYEAQRSEI
jgi:hypothetical protein